MSARIVVRAMKPEDLDAACAVEKSAVPMGNHYLRDAYPYYTTTQGELSVALIDDEIVGVGKLSVLFDGSGWLEILRVRREFQKKGIGTAIYHRYTTQMRKYNLHHAGLYTGQRNIGSTKLATRFGFRPDAFYVSYSTAIDMNQTYESCYRLCDKMPSILPDIKHLSINHTFYPNNERTLAGMLSQGWLFHDGDHIIVMGSRFQAAKALYVAYMEPDEKALRSALAYARLLGVAKLVWHFPEEMPLPLELLEKYSFTRDPGTDMVMSFEE